MSKKRTHKPLVKILPYWEVVNRVSGVVWCCDIPSKSKAREVMVVVNGYRQAFGLKPVDFLLRKHTRFQNGSKSYSRGGLLNVTMDLEDIYFDARQIGEEAREA